MSGWDVIDEGFKTKGASGNTKANELFMKIKDKHRVRFVGEPERIHIAWIGKKKYVVPQNYIERVEAAGHTVRDYFAINIFDRNDKDENGKQRLRVKILEKGRSIFLSIKENCKLLEMDHPGDKDGWDWAISASIPEDIRQTKYTVAAVKQTPFTPEEIEFFKRKKDPEKYKDLPLGERGVIDLKQFYNEEAAIKRLEAEVFNSSSKDSEEENIEDYLSGNSKTNPKEEVEDEDDSPENNSDDDIKDLF